MLLTTSLEPPDPHTGLSSQHTSPCPTHTHLPGSNHSPSPTDVAQGGRTTHDAVNASRASHTMLFPIPMEQRSRKSAGMLFASSPRTNARQIYSSSAGTAAPVGSPASPPAASGRSKSPVRVSPWAAPATPSYCQHCLARDSEACPLVLQGGGDPCSGLCKIWVPTRPGAPEEMLDCSSQPAPSSAAPDGPAVLARGTPRHKAALCAPGPAGRP